MYQEGAGGGSADTHLCCPRHCSPPMGVGLPLFGSLDSLSLNTNLSHSTVAWFLLNVFFPSPTLSSPLFLLSNPSPSYPPSTGCSQELNNDSGPLTTPSVSLFHVHRQSFDKKVLPPTRDIAHKISSRFWKVVLLRFAHCCA